MTTPTLTTTQLAALPRVNLLPPEIAEKRRMRMVKAGLGAAFAGSLVIVGGVYLLAHQSVSSAKSDLASAQSENRSLQLQAAKYGADEALRADRDAQALLLQTAMSNEIQWSHYLNDLSLRIPDNNWVTKVTITQANVPGAANGPSAGSTTTSGQSVLPDDGVGTITFEGVAFAYDDVATWLDSLAREKGYANPYFTESTSKVIGNTNVVKWTSSVSLTPAALSGRYTKPAGS